MCFPVSSLHYENIFDYSLPHVYIFALIVTTMRYIFWTISVDK